eukprot:4945024-Alexandrium_andersonii.AAC.3
MEAQIEPRMMPGSASRSNIRSLDFPNCCGGVAPRGTGPNIVREAPQSLPDVRIRTTWEDREGSARPRASKVSSCHINVQHIQAYGCLLYTSDAADDM